jgi:hypothetical protein
MPGAKHKLSAINTFTLVIFKIIVERHPIPNGVTGEQYGFFTE